MIESYLDQFDRKEDNTLGGDLWRAVLTSVEILRSQKNALEFMRLEVKMAETHLDRLSKLVDLIEKKWERELEAQCEANEAAEKAAEAAERKET